MVAAAARGQATTEAALGILLISTVIVFGIHFSEVGMLSLKVQEASTAAIWDTTAKRMETLTTATPDFTPKATAIGQAGPEATTRYVDFDGRTSKNGSSPVLVFTQASPIAVTCTADTALPAMNLASPPINSMFGAGQQGMQCYAESDFGLVPRFSRNFLENQPFRVQHVQRDTYHICSMGRANGNNCPARTVVALGDWGLADGVEANNCELVAPGTTPCANSGYYLMTKSAFTYYDGNIGAAAQAGNDFSTYVFNVPFGGITVNVDENAFFMAAVGEDWGQPAPYQVLPQGQEHAGFGPYTVTPGGPYDSVVLQNYRNAALTREPCAFGLPCDPTQWPRYQ